MKVRKRLSPTVVTAAQPGEKIWDSEDRRLFLRVSPKGVKAFLLLWNRTSTLSLGKWPGMTVDMARKRSLAAQQETLEQGTPAAVLEARGQGKRERIKLRAFIADHFKPWAEAHHKQSAATLEALEAVWSEALYDKELAVISPIDIERVKSKRLKAGRKPATVNRDLDRIRGVLSRAVEWGFLSGHPMRSVRRAKGDDNSRVRYLTGAEEARLREALEKREAKHRKERVSFNAHQAKRGKEGLPLWPADAFTDHLMPMILLAMNTGLRRGELFGIQWSNVNLPGKVLTVPAGIAKARKPRHIPLNAEAHDVLTRWKPKDVKPDALVYPSVEGARFNNINKSWAAVAEAAKLENFRFHDIRHSFASKLVMAGVDLNVVRELLGHADIAMTLRYAHLAPGKLADAVQKLEVRK